MTGWTTKRPPYERSAKYAGQSLPVIFLRSAWASSCTSSVSYGNILVSSSFRYVDEKDERGCKIVFQIPDPALTFV